MLSHYDNIKNFYNLHFKGLLTLEQFDGEKQILGKNMAVFSIAKIKYAIGLDHLKNLPLRIDNEKIISSNREVFHIITEYTPLKIEAKRELKFSELVDLMGGDINHSHKLDYLAYRLLIVSAYVGKLRLRFSTKPHFGKDSITWQLYLLTNNLINFTPKTVAGIEMFLDKPLLVMNELKDLNTEQLKYVSQLLHKITDDSPVYTRGAMTKGLPMLKQQYDLSGLSVVIFYNDRECSKKEGSYFDDLFDAPIRDRIMPFKFKGNLDMTQFNNSENEEEYMNTYSQMAHSLEWYRLNLNLNEIEIPKFDDEGKVKGRHIPIFNNIKKLVKIYCDENNLEFNQIMGVILHAHIRYDDIIGNKWDSD